MAENNSSSNGNPPNENAAPTQQPQQNFYYSSMNRNVIPAHLQGNSIPNLVHYVPYNPMGHPSPLYGHSYMWGHPSTPVQSLNSGNLINSSQQHQNQQNEERKKRPKHDEQQQQGRSLINSEGNLSDGESNDDVNKRSQRDPYGGNPSSGVKVLFSSPPFTTNVIPSIPETNSTWLPPSSSADPFNKLLSSSSSTAPMPPMAVWSFPSIYAHGQNPYDDFLRSRSQANNSSLYPTNTFPYSNTPVDVRKSNSQSSNPSSNISENNEGRVVSPYSSPYSEGYLNSSNRLSNGGRFVLKDQPNAFQRKSYKSERRYLTPNPLIICTRESCGDKSTPNLPRIVEGSVRVELVDGLGRKLDPNKKIFEPSDGQFEQPLNLKSSAEFSLKVLQNSGPDLFCLLFTVNYVTSTGERFIEQIQSRKFVVQSNKALKAREKPSVVGIKPPCGNNTQEVDVWIKGSEFHRQGILVCFGDRMGKVIEINENLLVVTVPMRADLKERMDVQVTVSNKYRNEVKTADKKLIYSYIPTNTT